MVDSCGGTSSSLSEQSSKFEGEYFDSVAQEYHRLIREACYEIDFDILVRYVDIASCSGILDLACGTGKFSLGILRRTAFPVVYAVDVSQQMLAIARRGCENEGMGHRLVTIKADLCAMPFGPAAFDAAVMGYAFHHIAASKRLSVLQGIAGSVRTGGHVAIFEIGRLHFIQVIDLCYEDSSIMNGLPSPAEVEQLMSSVGLNVVCSMARREYQWLPLDYVAQYCSIQGVVSDDAWSILKLLRNNLSDPAIITNDRFVCVASKPESFGHPSP